ncbi:MAG: HEAT repeat domain-containing protein [Gammaproteobacteria bacterium]|nr:HEAT repeat domain-containing protein [Gammaproteobacteria bacterium]
MRRILVLFTVVVALLSGAFLTVFLASGYYSWERGLTASMGDLLFSGSVSLQRQFGRPVPPLNDTAYASVSGRLVKSADSKAKSLARARLADWGEAVVPRLLHDLDKTRDFVRQGYIVRVLGKIGSVEAVPALTALLQRPDNVPILNSQIVSALGSIGHSDVLASLIGFYESPRGATAPATALDAIGRCGGVDYLLEKLHGARDTDNIITLLKALAETRSRKTALVVAGYLHHGEPLVRIWANNVLDKLGPEAMPVVMDWLLAETDDYIRGMLVWEVLDDADTHGDARVVPYLESLLEHSALQHRAIHALAGIDSPESIQALQRAEDRLNAHKLVDSLKNAPRNSGPLLLNLLDNPLSGVRYKAMQELVKRPSADVEQRLEEQLARPEPWLRRFAADALLKLDKYRLWYAHADYFGLRDDLRAWHGWWGAPLSGFPTAVRVPHAVAMVFGLSLGLFLIFNIARPFEFYRFHLALQLLALEGFLGAFLFFGDSMLEYHLAVTLTLVLLLGYYFMDRGNQPGTTQGLFGRLGGASLWLLVPAMIYFGVPVLADGLRHAFSDVRFSLAWLGLLALIALLLLEEYLIPWRLVPRSARSRRWLVGSLSLSMTGLLGYAIVRDIWHPTHTQDPARVELAALFLVALLVMWVFQVFHLKPVSQSHKRSESLQPVPSRFRVVDADELLTVRIPTGRFRGAWVLTLIGIALLALGTWIMATGDWSRSGSASAVTAALVGVAGLLLAWRSFAIVWPRRLLQVNRGYVRIASTVLGGALWGGHWRRRPRVESLDAEERKWLSRVLRRSQFHARATKGELASLLLFEPQAIQWVDPVAGRVHLPLKVTNNHDSPLSMAQLDDLAGKPVWDAEVNGERVGLSLGRSERETLIAPGHTVTLYPWIWLPLAVQEAPEFRLALVAGKQRTAEQDVSTDAGAKP